MLRGLTPTSAPSTTRSSTRAGSSAICREPAAGDRRVLVLDPQAAGALLRRRPRVRPRGRIEGSNASSGRRRLDLRAGRIPFLRRAGAGRICDSARGRRAASASGGAAPITSSSRSGRRIARRISRTAPRWSAPRSRASKAASSTPMRLYEQAIRSARANGFVQNEALAHELAARFYAARGFETIAHAVPAERPLLLPALGRRWQGAAAR